MNTTESTIYLWQRTCPIPCDHIPVRSWPLFRACQLMRDNIESLQGEMITRRFATVDGNLRGNKRLHRFTLCGKAKVDEWKLFCLV